MGTSLLLENWPLIACNVCTQWLQLRYELLKKIPEMKKILLNIHLANTDEWMTECTEKRRESSCCYVSGDTMRMCKFVCFARIPE